MQKWDRITKYVYNGLCCEFTAKIEKYGIYPNISILKFVSDLNNKEILLISLLL